MSHTHSPCPYAISPSEYSLEQIHLPVFEKAPKCESAKVSDLHHSGQLAVHEKRCFDDPFYMSKQSSLSVEVSHQFSVLLSDALVVVMN